MLTPVPSGTQLSLALDGMESCAPCQSAPPRPPLPQPASIQIGFWSSLGAVWKAWMLSKEPLHPRACDCDKEGIFTCELAWFSQLPLPTSPAEGQASMQVAPLRARAMFSTKSRLLFPRLAGKRPLSIGNVKNALPEHWVVGINV